MTVMAAYTSISIICNPNSKGNSVKEAEKLRAFLAEHYEDLEVNIHKTSWATHAETIAYDCAKASAHPLIISSSGDGGYHEVINGAMKAQEEGTQPICAVLPAGNANDHQRALQRSELPEAIIKESITKIDLLKVSVSEASPRYAHSYVGLGITPVIAAELNRYRLNLFKELRIVLKAFYKLSPFEIKVGGEVFILDSILFTNIGRMAKFFKVSKTAKINDGRFEVIIFPHAPKVKFIGRVLQATTAGLKPKIHYRKYGFQVLQPTPIQLDGEISEVAGGADVVVTCEKRILRTVL
jgi:diacylglycerol kinase (ATP)